MINAVTINYTYFKMQQSASLISIKIKCKAIFTYFDVILTLHIISGNC